MESELTHAWRLQMLMEQPMKERKIEPRKRVTFEKSPGTPESVYVTPHNELSSSSPPADPRDGKVGTLNDEKISSCRGRWASGLAGVLEKTGLLGSSDSVFDAWLTATAAQVGLIVLSLPYTFSQLGIAWTVGCFVGFALLGWWAVYLLSWMYLDYKAKLDKQADPPPAGHVVQYHEVIGGMAGTLAGYVTFCFIIGGNALGAVIQVVSAASNLYFFSDSLDKRHWTFVICILSLISIFLPNFKHFRPISIVGVLSSSITAIYLIVASTHGQVKGVVHSGPMDNLPFFTGITNLIFSLGGQNITVEIMDAMKHPSKFKNVYAGVICYTLALVLPSGVSVYWANGDISFSRSNAFAVIPKSAWRTFSIALMVSHQVVIYVVLAVTVFIAFEKASGVHTGSRHMVRVLRRIPIVLIIWFVALAVPFFGLINSLMGAFLVTAGGYVIPPMFFFIAYYSPAARASSVQQPPLLMGRSWVVLFIFNGLVVSFMVNVGMGWGGWASISNVIQQISTLRLFDRCYQCTSESNS